MKKVSIILIAVLLVVVSFYACKSKDMEPEVIQEPVFTPNAGTVASGTKVSIKCDTAGTDIYYTTDENNPTSSSNKYEGPIEITSSTTFKAIAIKQVKGSGDEPSQSGMVEAKYTIQ